jgi:hypothetical protein
MVRKLTIKESQDVEIEVRNKGVLEVPEGKSVDELPIKHFVAIADKKGLDTVTKALNNLQVWNKNKNKALSKWAGDMIDKVSKRFENRKDESYHAKYRNHILEDYDIDFDEITIPEDERYKFIKSKTVLDSDGFQTEYTMYYDWEDDKYIFIFGDSDLYDPTNTYADYECDSEREANEWFADYEGFEYGLDESLEESEDIDKKEPYGRYMVLIKPYKNMFQLNYLDNLFDKSNYCFFDKDGYVDTDYTGISKSLFDKIYNKDMKPSKAYEVYTDGLYGDVISYEEVPKNWFHL